MGRAASTVSQGPQLVVGRVLGPEVGAEPLQALGVGWRAGALRIRTQSTPGPAWCVLEQVCSPAPRTLGARKDAE